MVGHRDGARLNRATLAGPATRSGPGLHLGVDARVRLGPAPFGSGITFVTPSGPVPADLAHADAEPGCTVLRCGAASVSTPEHLLAALCALGVTDAVVDVDGPELPALDGSALDWVRAIDEAGRVDGPPLRPVHLATELRVDGFGGSVTAFPAAEPGALAVDVDFGAGGPVGQLRVPRTEAAFRAEIAWARTFVLARDVDALRAAGRGRGATADNTVLWPGGAVQPDEPVRHKLLDAWGDLALLGPGLAASITVSRGSHRLHLAGLREVARALRVGPYEDLGADRGS